MNKTLFAVVFALIFTLGSAIPAYALWWDGYDEAAAQFSHGEDITRDDVLTVFEALVEYRRDLESYDFRDLMETANVSDEDVVEFLWILSNSAEYKDWRIELIGESWLFGVIDMYMDDIEYGGVAGGEPWVEMEIEYYAARLINYLIIAELEKTFGIEQGRTLHSNTLYFYQTLGIWLPLLDFSHYSEALERFYSEYGADTSRFNMYRELIAFSEGTETLGATLWDELHGGLLSENREALAEWMSENRGEIVRHMYRYDRFPLTDRFHFILRSFGTEETNRLEHKIWYYNYTETQYEIQIRDSNLRLNLFYENTSEYLTTFVYIISDLHGNYVSVSEAEIAQGERFTTQLNFADLELTESDGDNHWFIDVYVAYLHGGQDMVDLTAQNPRGSFSFRLTEYPLGIY
jgi:hypothetical protein